MDAAVDRRVIGPRAAFGHVLRPALPSCLPGGGSAGKSALADLLRFCNKALRRVAAAYAAAHNLSRPLDVGNSEPPRRIPAPFSAAGRGVLTRHPGRAPAL